MPKFYSGFIHTQSHIHTSTYTQTIALGKSQVRDAGVPVPKSFMK